VSEQILSGGITSHSDKAETNALASWPFDALSAEAALVSEHGRLAERKDISFHRRANVRNGSKAEIPRAAFFPFVTLRQAASWRRRPGEPAVPKAICSREMFDHRLRDRFALSRAAGSPGLAALAGG